MTINLTVPNPEGSPELKPRITVIGVGVRRNAVTQIQMGLEGSSSLSRILMLRHCPIPRPSGASKWAPKDKRPGRRLQSGYRTSSG